MVQRLQMQAPTIMLGHAGLMLTYGVFLLNIMMLIMLMLVASCCNIYF